MDNWYFSRLELAQHFMKVLEVGISPNLAIFAARRKGKSVFLLKDLAPLAQRQGYLPVYASLWQNCNAPYEPIISAIEETLAVVNKKGAISRILTSKVKKTSVSNEFIGKMELEFADDPKEATNKNLMRLDTALSELEAAAGKKTVLLLIDEIQHLATSTAFQSLTHALRTALDKRQGDVKAVFTGSSRHYMKLLFDDKEAAFYQFVDVMAFPDLGIPFIEFIASKLAKDHKIKVSTDALMKVFESLERSPYWVLKVVNYMVTSDLKLSDAHGLVQEILEKASNIEVIAKKLKPIDIIVFLTITEDKSPFTSDVLARIEKETPVKGVSSNVQRSITRLKNMHIISQLAPAEYQIELPGLSNYLKNK